MSSAHNALALAESRLSCTRRIRVDLHEAGVEAACPHELFVSPLFHDFALAQDNDLVCVADGGQAVSDDHGGPPIHESPESSRYLRFGLGVDRRRCFFIGYSASSLTESTSLSTSSRVLYGASPARTNEPESRIPSTFASVVA